MLDLIRIDVYGQKMPINQLATVTVPESGSIRVQRILRVVLLPEPLGPRRPKRAPFGIARVNFLRASTDP